MANSSESPCQSDSIRYNRTRFRIWFENSRNSRMCTALKDSKDTLIKKFLSLFEFYQYLGLNIYRISLSVIIMHFFLTCKPSPIYKNEVLSEHQRIQRDSPQPKSGPKVMHLSQCHTFENNSCTILPAQLKQSCRVLRTVKPSGQRLDNFHSFRHNCD